MRKRLILGTLGAIAGAVLGAIGWAAVTASTGYQIGYVAVAVGFLAGYGMRTLGGGRDRADGVIAAVVAFLGCVLGDLLTAVAQFAPHDALHRTVPQLALLVLLTPKIAWFMLHETFNIMDIVFYAIAVYAAYRTALKPAPPQAAAVPRPGSQ
jgi:uncharacterized membrane protein